MSTLAQRFEGDDGNARLVAALRQNRLVYDDSFAKDLASVARVQVAHQGENLIRQGDSDDDILFLLVGRVGIVINGREIAIRGSGQHVGEMALIDPSAKRSATAVALEDTAFARVAEADFARAAKASPHCWKLLAAELGLDSGNAAGL